MKEKTYKFEGSEYTIDQLEDLARERGYSMYVEDIENSDEVTIVATLNPENTQKTILMLVDIDDYEYEDAKLELSLGNGYCDYDIEFSTASKLRNQIRNHEYDSENEYVGDSKMLGEISVDIATYNDYVSLFNLYGDAQKLDENMYLSDALEVIERNSTN